MMTESFMKLSSFEASTGDRQLRWCAIGDSFTYLNDHIDQTDFRMKKGYLSRVCDELAFLTLKNMGVNGSTTKDWLHMRIAKADLYTILLGTNDWKQGIPVGDEQDFTEKRTGTILGNLSVIIDNIKKANPNAPIIVLNPVERGDFVYINDYHNTAPGSYQQINGQNLKEVAKKIYQCVQGEKIMTVDLNTLCGFDQFNVIKFKRVRTREGFRDLPYPDYIGIPYDPDQDGYPYPIESIALTYDGLHPSDEGSTIIGDIVKDAIVRVLKLQS